MPKGHKKSKSLAPERFQPPTKSVAAPAGPPTPKRRLPVAATPNPYGSSGALDIGELVESYRVTKQNLLELSNLSTGAPATKQQKREGEGDADDQTTPKLETARKVK